MTLLKQINKPSLFLYEQMYIKLFHHSNELIPKQHLNEHNLMFELTQHKCHTSHPTWQSTLLPNPTSSFSTCTLDIHLQG
jgi:hypothetical protein